jgi:hypothetical protein
MAKINYIVNFYVEWNDGTTTSSTLKFHIKHLKELFDLLYEMVVLGSISDVELYSPGMINEINMDIIKKLPGRVYLSKKSNPIIDPDIILAFNSAKEANVKYDLRYSLKYKGTAMGSLDFVNENLKEVFDQLYAEVVEPSIMDPITDKIIATPEMLNDIHIAITKKRVKRIKK